MICFVGPLGVVHFSLTLSHPRKRVFFLRDGVVVVGLEGAVFFEEVLVDLFEGFLLRENSTSVRLQMVVVIIAGKGGLRLWVAIEERNVYTPSS